MNWSYKIAFDEIQEMLDNRPWVLVDDDFSSANNDDFIGMQKKILLERGWEWFKNALRGRFFPKLNLTTLTTWNSEQNPDQGDPEPNLVAKVERNFPGISIVSLIGGPHVISGPPVVLDVLEHIGKIADSQRWKLRIKKAARAENAEVEKPYYKDEFQFEIADVDRYATDKYFANLAIQETHNLYSIGFQMYNYQVGITGAAQYWHYEKNELDRAKRTFKKIKTALTETMMDIEYHRPPMAIITPMIRAALQTIDVAHKERSGNYFYNWFEELTKEPDWRLSLYGNRYPPVVIQYIGSSWNTDDISKEITVQGTSSRSRILRYKPSHGITSKHAADNSHLYHLLLDKWKIPAVGVGGVLAWLLSLGISPSHIEQQLQNGATPQQVITQVSPKEPPFSQSEISTPALNNADFVKNEQFFASPPVEGLDNDSENSRIPRGIRNNNPGNLEHNKTVWQGMAENQSDERFVTFSSPEYGIRAMARVLKNYGRRHGLGTIEQIVSRWAPASENQTDSYIQHVSQELAVPANSPLDLNDPALLDRLIRAMIKHENGTNPYDSETISRGIALEKGGATTGKFRTAIRWEHVYVA